MFHANLYVLEMTSADFFGYCLRRLFRILPLKQFIFQIFKTCINEYIYFQAVRSTPTRQPSINIPSILITAPVFFSYYWEGGDRSLGPEEPAFCLLLAIGRRDSSFCLVLQDPLNLVLSTKRRRLPTCLVLPMEGSGVFSNYFVCCIRVWGTPSHEQTDRKPENITFPLTTYVVSISIISQLSIYVNMTTITSGA